MISSVTKDDQDGGQPSPEMVERVKAAIAHLFAPAIDFRAPYAKVMLDYAGKAAIEAMRVPTVAMIDAADDICAGSVVPEDYWRVMIAAALSPTTDTSRQDAGEVTDGAGNG